MTAAPVSTTDRLTAFEYELLAEYDTVAGNEAWCAGDYRRATVLWLSAARWSQFARDAEAGAR